MNFVDIIKKSYLKRLKIALSFWKDAGTALNGTTQL